MKPNSGSKEIYNRLKLQRMGCKFKLKWNIDLALNIDFFNLLGEGYFFKYFILRDNQLIWFQYRLIHRILGTNTLLQNVY